MQKQNKPKETNKQTKPKQKPHKNQTEQKLQILYVIRNHLNIIIFVIAAAQTSKLLLYCQVSSASILSGAKSF